MIVSPLLSPLLSIVPFAAVSFPSVLPAQGKSAPAAVNVLKVYDLSSALPGASGGRVGKPLLPFLIRGSDSEGSEWDPGFGADTLVDLLRNLCGDEFDYEGRQLSNDGQGHLIVKAPPATQAMTERYLTFLEGIFGASTEIVIDALDRSEGAGEGEVPVLIPIADVDKILARTGSGGRRTWRLQVHAGKTARLDLTKIASLVTDYDVEVAQASGIADPIVEEISVGTQIVAGAAPQAGGTWLALILRRGDPLSEIQERDLALQHAITAHDRVAFLDSARAYQSIDVLNRSLAFSTFLPEGKALAIRTSVVAAGKPHAEMLIVRRGAGALPIFARASLEPKAPSRRTEVLFVNAQSAVPPHCEIEAPALMRAAAGSWSMLRYDGMEQEVSAGIGIGSLDMLREVVGEKDDLRIRDVGACLFLTHETGAGEGDEAAAGKKADDPIETFSRFAPPARVAQVAVALRRGGGGAELARCALPLRDGEPAALVLGAEGIEVADFNVEVAQGSTIADPLTRVGFDGIALWLKPTFTLSGDLTLEVLARAHVRSGPAREFDLRVSGLGKLDESSYDQLFARERFVFGKGEGAARRFVIGEAGGPDSKGSLALEVEASEIR